MKVGEIVRSRTGRNESSSSGGSDPTLIGAEIVEVENDDLSDVETMIAPLQQTHELLKKAGGVENSVAEFAGPQGSEGGAKWEHSLESDTGEIPVPGDCSDYDYETEYKTDASAGDEINIMKKMAGIGQDQGQDSTQSMSIQTVDVNPRKNAAESHFGKKQQDTQ